jgi:transposase
MIKIKLTAEQRQKVDYDLQVSNYVYNKAVSFINSGKKVSKLSLRDQLVTIDSRKRNVLLNKVNSSKTKIESIINELKKVRSLKSVVKAIMIKEKWWKPIKALYDIIRYFTPSTRNQTIKDFEMLTHKDIRAGSVFEAHTNYINNCNAVKTGRIKFFQLNYRSKKKNGMSMTLSNNMIKITDGVLRFTSRDLVDKVIRVNNRSRKKLTNITSLKDCKLTKKFGVYHIRIPLDVKMKTPDQLSKIIGIDPGVSTFLSCYTPDQTVTIKQTNRCKGYDKLRCQLKQMRKNKERKRIRRRLLNKLDLKKQYLIDELHWKSIRYLLNNYDIIFIEKFDSQGFVKNGKSKNLNKNTNNLKPYQFRERLLYKASVLGKIVEVVKAYNTTKTCSNCGCIKEMRLTDREYHCNGCNQVLDRDFNAAKNMILKGLCC